MDNAYRIIIWLGNFILKNPWPTVAIIVISLLLILPWARFAVKDLLRSLGIKKIKLSSAEIEFGREDNLIVQRTFDESVKVIEQYRVKINKKVDRLIRMTGLDTAFSQVVAAVFECHFAKKFGVHGMRATIHMQDFVFENQLLQILEYYPTGGGKQRHFSYRRGIVGRVWRSQIGSSAGYLTHKVAPQPLPDDAKLVADICLEWALTEKEALSFKKKPSYCCVPIKYNHKMLGVLYIDCEKPNFGWNSEIEIKSKLKKMERCCQMELEDKKIPKILSEIEEAMAELPPRRNLEE